MPRNTRGVRVTLYLPDDLRERARAANLNLSRILRDAVERELRGDRPGPSVGLERQGDAIEMRVTVPLDELRRRIR